MTDEQNNDDQFICFTQEEADHYVFMAYHTMLTGLIMLLGLFRKQGKHPEEIKHLQTLFQEFDERLAIHIRQSQDLAIIKRHYEDQNIGYG